MKKESILLKELEPTDRTRFIQSLQDAFVVSAQREFGENVGTVMPISEIEESIDSENAFTYVVWDNNQPVGGVVVQIDIATQRNSLDLLYVDSTQAEKGIGLAVWQKIEVMFPDTFIWETYTPYFDKRNIHFYVNKCGFSIVEFYHPGHQMPHQPSEDVVGGDYFFRFEKKMKEKNC